MCMHTQKYIFPWYCMHFLCHLRLEVRFLPSSASKHVNYLRSVSLKLVIQSWFILKWPNLSSSPLKFEDTKIRTKILSKIQEQWDLPTVHPMMELRLTPSSGRTYFMARAEHSPPTTVIFHGKTIQRQTWEKDQPEQLTICLSWMHLVPAFSPSPIVFSLLPTLKTIVPSLLFSHME